MKANALSAMDKVQGTLAQCINRVNFTFKINIQLEILWLKGPFIINAS